MDVWGTKLKCEITLVSEPAHRPLISKSETSQLILDMSNFNESYAKLTIETVLVISINSMQLKHHSSSQLIGT
jgi:hypothetical protein